MASESVISVNSLLQYCWRCCWGVLDKDDQCFLFWGMNEHKKLQRAYCQSIVGFPEQRPVSGIFRVISSPSHSASIRGKLEKMVLKPFLRDLGITSGRRHA